MGIALDTETTSLEWWKGHIFGMSHCLNDKCYDYDLIPKYSKEYLAKLIGSETDIIFHNAKFDLHFLKNAGYLDLLKGRQVHDTMIMSYLLDENKSHHLNDVAKRYAQAPDWKDEVKDYVKKNNCGYEQVPYETMKTYSARDSLYTYKIFNAMVPELKAQNLWDLYLTEMELLPVILNAERRGVLIDVKALQDISPKLEERENNLKAEIYKYSGKEFNIMSEEELGDILYKELKLPIPGYSEKSQKPKTDKYALEKLDHPIGKLVTNYRLTHKLRDTYCANILDLVDSEHVLHCDLKQNGARTGRFSCQHPNLQNIPDLDDEEGNQELTIVRRGFICRPGYYNFYFDYKQMELMMYAHFANETNMKEAFARGEDLHRSLGCKFYHKDRIDDNERFIIKTLNFGILYGMGAKGVAERFKKPYSEAKQILNDYYTSFPIMKKFRWYLTDKIKSCGYLRNPFGRRRRLEPQDAYKGVNSLVQGTCADIMKQSMIRIAKVCRGTKSNLLLSIHDEAKIEIHKSELDLVPEIQKVMEDYPQFTVPLKVDIEYTKTNWKEKECFNIRLI
jgi:DNA polymerase-1